jgi:hypothetical protein
MKGLTPLGFLFFHCFYKIDLKSALLSREAMRRTANLKNNLSYFKKHFFVTSGEASSLKIVREL